MADGDSLVSSRDVRHADCMALVDALELFGGVNTLAYGYAELDVLKQAGLLESVPARPGSEASGGVLLTATRLAYQLQLAFERGKQMGAEQAGGAQ